MGFSCRLFFRWERARDIMLMSHLQEHVAHSDIPTQVLYNRAMVQLGLCAFRIGKPLEAQNALSDIMQTNRWVPPDAVLRKTWWSREVLF